MSYYELVKSKIYDYISSNDIDTTKEEVFKENNEYFKLFSELSHEIVFNKDEEKILAIYMNMRKSFVSLINLWGKESIYKLHVPDFDLELEKNLIAKLVVLATISCIVVSDTVNLDSEYVKKIIKDFATEELRNDLDFARVLAIINGKYYSAFANEVKNNENILKVALLNDKDDIPSSFLDSPIRFQTDYKNALIYVNKLNKKYDVDEIYNMLFRFREGHNNPYPHDNYFTGFKNYQIQKYWLSNPYFLVGLIDINEEFRNYIIDNKIMKYASSLDTIEELEKQEKKYTKRHK